jgi:hypothetical protein
MDADKPHFPGHRQRLWKRFIRSGFQGFADDEVVEMLQTLAIPRFCEVAMHSRFRPHEFRSRKQPGHDVTELERGFITVSELRLSIGRSGKPGASA